MAGNTVYADLNVGNTRPPDGLTSRAHRHFIRFRDGLRRPRKLNTVIFFVTSRCNATCNTCFYWQELNQRGDLSLDEIRNLSASMPAFTDLWLSGGEPTLRRELGDIIDIFVRQNGVQYINLPTNGLKPARIHGVVRRALMDHSGLEVHVNIAIDGFRDTHDRLRGVPGNFEKALESALLLRTLKDQFGPRLKVNLNTVITRDNVDEVAALAGFIEEHVPVDSHYFNLVRGESRDKSLHCIDASKLRRLYPKLAALQWRYAEGLIEAGPRWVRWIKKAYYVGTLTLHHRIQVKNHERAVAWPMPCTAGETSAVIDFDGRVRACEMRKPVADLRNMDMDFKVFWESEARQDEVAQIACDECWCSHVCFIHDSLRYSRRGLLFEVPRSYLSRKAW